MGGSTGLESASRLQDHRVTQDALVPAMGNGPPPTRVMSPTRGDYSPNMGLLLGISIPCPQCGANAAEPLTCSSCGRYGHPSCLQAEWFMSLPCCGSCLRRAGAGYSVQHGRRTREAWRGDHAQHLLGLHGVVLPGQVRQEAVNDGIRMR